MAIAETARSGDKASGELRPSTEQTCRKARFNWHLLGLQITIALGLQATLVSISSHASSVSQSQQWLQASSHSTSINSALSRSDSTSYAASQLGTDPAAPLLAFSGMSLAFGASPQLFPASQNAGGNVTIAAQRSTSTLDAQDSGSKGGLGGKSDTKTTGFERDITSSTMTGGNVSIVSQGGNVILEAANVESKGNLNISAVNGAVAILSATSESYFQTDKKESNVAVQRTSGSGNYDKNVITTKLTGNLVIDTNKIIADLPASKGMEELAKQPGMSWINTIQNDPALAGKVDWKKIDEAHKEWSYDKQGLSPAGAVILSLAVAYATAGAGSGSAELLGMGSTATTAAGVSTFTASAAGATLNAAASAALSSLASQAAVGLVNNGGNLGKTLSDLGSSESLRGLAMSMVTAGALQGLAASGWLPDNIAGATAKSPFTDQLTKNLINNAAAATIRSALTGTSLEANLKSSIVDAIITTGMAQGANLIGDAASGKNDTIKLNEFGRAVAHAVAGCVAGAAKAQSGDGCSAGAVGAVVGELAAQFYNDGTGIPKKDTTVFAALMSGVAGALVGGDAKSVNLAASTGANAAANNYLNHAELTDKLALEKQKAAACGVDVGSVACVKATSDLNKIISLDEGRDKMLRESCTGATANEANCKAYKDDATSAVNSINILNFRGVDVNAAATEKRDTNQLVNNTRAPTSPAQGSVGVGFYTPLGGGEIEVEFEQGSLTGAKVGIGVGIGGHVSTGGATGGMTQGLTQGGKSVPIYEANPIEQGTIRIGASGSVGGGLGVIGAEISGSAGVAGDDKTKQSFGNFVIQGTTVPGKVKIGAEAKMNIIEIQVKPSNPNNTQSNTTTQPSGSN